MSSAWRSGESPGSSAAASPPCAQKLALWESGVRETAQTRPPCSAARSAVQRPTAPPPMTTTSYSATAAVAALAPDLIDPLAQPGGGPFAGAGALGRDRFLGFLGAALGGGDPLLGGVGCRLDLAQPLLGGDRALLGLALLLQLFLVAQFQRLQVPVLGGAVFLQIGLERTDLGLGAFFGRAAASAAAASVRSASPIRAVTSSAAAECSSLI